MTIGSRSCCLLAVVAALAAAAGCKTNNVSESSSTSNTTNNNTTVNNVTKTVGPKGAHVESPGGAAVDIPPGALTEDVVIRIGEVPTKDGYPALPGDAKLVGKVFAFEPHGQTFATDVVVTVPHTAGGTGATVALLRAEKGGAWGAAPVKDHTAAHVQTTTTTFSFFTAVLGADGGAGGAGGASGSGGAGGATSAGGAGGATGAGGKPGLGGAGGASGSGGSGGFGGASTTGGCPPNTWDLDQNPLTGQNGCEYSCTKVSNVDPIDDKFLDEDCDGSDGTLEACVFVSGTFGQPGGDGTRNQPYDTIAHAMPKAKATTKTLCLAGGETFAEAVALDDGVSLYGGFDPGDVNVAWRRSASAVSTIEAAGTVVSIASVGAEMHVEGLTLHALPPAGEGASAYGVRSGGGAGALFIRWNVVSVGAGTSASTPATAAAAASCAGGGASGKGGLGGGGSIGVLVAAGTATIAGNDFTVAKGAVGGGGGQGGPSFAGCGSPPVGSPGVAGLALGTLVNGLYVPASGGDGVAGKNGGAGGPGAGGSGGPSCCVMQAAGLNLAPAGNSCAPAGPGSGGSPATNDGVTSATGLLGSSGNLLTLP